MYILPGFIAAHIKKEYPKDNLITYARIKANVLTSAAGLTLKGIQSIDYSWGEISFEYRPMNRVLSADVCCEETASGYDMDIEPDDISVSDTVTVIWEIE